MIDFNEANQKNIRMNLMEYVQSCDIGQFANFLFMLYNKGWFDKSDHVDNESWVHDILPYMESTEALYELSK